MVVNDRPLKRAKRRVTAVPRDFLTFPSSDDDGIPIAGPFRSSVKTFLALHGRFPPPPPSMILSPIDAESSQMVTWRVAFRVGEEMGRAGVVEMDVVEEDVARSRSVYCDQCRVVGWSGHPVCGKRYHFIIRNDSNPLSGYHQLCARCRSVLHMLDSRCMACKYEMTVEDFEDWAYLQLEDSTHLLHGVVHANGYGHLLRVNGREGGSKYLTGCDIMGFWDRLCKMLHVRKVTVMDKSKKYGMEYRLLHAVTAGHPWYGNWGYEFGAGSYALTAESYKKAVETLSSMPLSFFFSQARSRRTLLQNKISLYCSLSGWQLETVRHLFCYVTQLLHDAHQHSSQIGTKSKKQTTEATSGVLCAWTGDDVEKVEGKIMKILSVAGKSRWLAYHALRGTLCHSVESLELLDYCLKGLGGKSVDRMVVAVRCNPENSNIEYRVVETPNQQLPTQNQNRPSAGEILRDLKFLYDAILNPSTMHQYRPQPMREAALTSATKLLDCKQFIKHYDEPMTTGLLRPSNSSILNILCHVEVVDQQKDYPAPPPEPLTLPISATVADLKRIATRAFQDTYLIFQKFQAEQLLECEYVSDSTNVKLLLGRNGVVRVRGRCHGDDRRLGQFRMERGLDHWIVDCGCGAKDDDGERMMACDACGVWQHTRCAGISDYEAVPVKFVCKKCRSFKKRADHEKPKDRRASSVRCNKDDGMTAPPSSVSRSGTHSHGRCKDEVAAASPINRSGSYGHIATVG